MNESLDFAYKLGKLILGNNIVTGENMSGEIFLSQSGLNNNFTSAGTNIYFQKFCNKVMAAFNFAIDSIHVLVTNNPDIVKFINEKKEIYKQYFEEIKRNFLVKRIKRYTDPMDPSSSNATLFFSFEEPVNVTISESEFYEIKALLAQTPDFDKILEKDENLKKLSINECLMLCLSYVLERDVRIYENYGIKMEDFVYAILLYEN